MKGEPNAATRASGGEEPAEKLQRCLSEWLRIIARDKTFVAASEEAEEPDADDWRRLSLEAGIRFAEAMAVVYPHWQRLFRGWHPFLQSEYLELLLTPGGNLDSTVERKLLAHYRKTLWDIFMAEVGSPLAGLTPESWDTFAFWGIQELSDTALMTRASEHLELAAILTSHLAYEARQSFVERDRRDLKRSLDFGSIVRDGDLAALAHRNADAIERYGAKNVERRFEERISAVLQSLGLFVVATSVGERRADLVAFSPSGEFTLIVEAKSASRPYALPTKDSRALVEYVGATKETLATLPPVRLLVIVGPDSYTTVGCQARNADHLGRPDRMWARSDLLGHRSTVRARCARR